MNTSIDLFMPAAQFETVLCKLGFYSEHKILYARKSWNDTTNKQSDLLEIPNLVANDSVCSIFVRS